MEDFNDKNNDRPCSAVTRTIHKMKLAPEPFELIASRQKTVEMRLYDEKRRKVMPGDVIEFTNIADGRNIFARVKEISVFPSFAELFNHFDLAELGYTEENKAEASPDDLYKYYTPENEKKYGAAGLKIELIL